MDTKKYAVGKHAAPTTPPDEDERVTLGDWILTGLAILVAGGLVAGAGAFLMAMFLVAFYLLGR